MNPYISWAVALSFVGAASYYYNASGEKPQSSRGRSGTASEGSQAQPKAAKKEPKAKLKADITSASESEIPVSTSRDKTDAPAPAGAKQRKAGKGKSQAQVAPQVAVQPSKPVHDDGADKAWAQQMANVRKGTNLSVPSKDASRTKTVKTSALETPGQAFSSASSTGAEADDDMSPALSPSIQAGDVSDMLEPAKAGPSVLRLTEPSNPAPQRAPRQQKEFQEAETKKQRQNKKKNEERKALIQEQEKERQRLLETQRRTAREARGEPARNGLQQAKAPASNAWDGSEKKTVGAPVVEPLLDTFDRAEPPAVGNAQASIVPIHPPHGAGNGATVQQPATAASEDESGWATVGTKKAKKGHNRDNSDVPAEVKPVTEAPPAAPKQAKQPAGPKVTNGFASLDSGIDAGTHPDDSEWGA